MTEQLPDYKSRHWKKGLIANPFSRFPMSRDFEQTMKCSNTTCPYHDKGSYCSSPSIVEIGVDGRCKPYSDWVAKTIRK
jgi:hypothetical protein